MTPITPTWLTQSTSEAQVKAAFEGALTAGFNTYLDPESGARNGLEARSFCDLQLYVYTGMALPRTQEAFERDLPEEMFKELAQIDAELYPWMRSTILDISENCNQFNDQWLGRIVLSANTAITYAETAIGMLREDVDLNFKSQLGILLDPRYGSRESQQEERFQEAVEGATLALEHLRNTAKDKAKEAGNIVAALVAFEGRTQLDKKNVDLLHIQFTKGPVTKIKTREPIPDQEPYGKFLNARVAGLLEQLQNTVKGRDEAHSKWAKYTGWAIGTSPLFIPTLGLGGIAVAVFAALAVEQRRSYAALVETLEAERRDQQAVVDLLAIVSRLSYQFEDLSQKMLKAITAMKALQELFSNQAMNYELIITDLAGVTGGISAKALKWRKTWIESRIDAAVVHLHQVKSNALEFQRTARLEKTDTYTVGEASTNRWS